MRYKATRAGFYGSRRLAAGDEFEGPDDLVASWVEPVEEKVPKPPASKKKRQAKKKAAKA